MKSGKVEDEVEKGGGGGWALIKMGVVRFGRECNLNDSFLPPFWLEKFHCHSSILSVFSSSNGNSTQSLLLMQSKPQ